eukprot:403376772
MNRSTTMSASKTKEEVQSPQKRVKIFQQSSPMKEINGVTISSSNARRLERELKILQEMYDCLKIKQLTQQNVMDDPTKYKQEITKMREYKEEINFFTKTFLSTNSEDNDSQTNIIILVIKLILSVLYNIWILIIYIMAMTLNTFWVQDIFDKLIEIQLGKQFGERALQNPQKYMKQLQEAEQVQVSSQLREKSIYQIQRVLIVTMYIIIASVVNIAFKILFNNFLAAITQIFLFSLLHAYYCYEYKTTLMDINLTQSIDEFEKQWAYFGGFGFLFTLILYVFQDVGSSTFFLFFPLMVVISLDEHGQGLLAFKKGRYSTFSLPIFTMANNPNKVLLRYIRDKYNL